LLAMMSGTIREGCLLPGECGMIHGSVIVQVIVDMSEVANSFQVR
jgi:hypothetical protein